MVAERGAVDYVPVTPRVRHVWLNTSARPNPVLYAGVVVAWRREQSRADGSGWFAQVAYVPTGTSGRDQLVVGWFAAEQLRPAVVDDTGTSRPHGS